MLYTKKFVITVSLCAMLAVNPVWAVTDPVSAVAGAKSGTPGVVSTVYSDWAGRAESGIAGVSYVNSAVDAAGNAAQWAENHAAAAAQSAKSAAGSASDAAKVLEKAVLRPDDVVEEGEPVGSESVPVYVKADGTVATITSYAGTSARAIADKNGAQIDTTYEKLSNKVTALSANSTNTQYPGAKLVYDELAKKQASLGYTAENTANKVTALSATSTDTQYPSAKAVYTELGKKQSSLGYTAENTANKVTALSATSTDTQYPSAKAVYTELAKKQGTISDLATIRSGAAAGATAVQPEDLAAVATSGSYIDLSDKPTIGSGTLTINRNGALLGTFNANATGASVINITDNDTKYTLPVATSDTLGGVKQGTNITIASDGTISAKDTVYTLPAATSSTLGGVKTGTNITNNSGTISVNTTAVPAANSGVPFTAGGAFTELDKKQDKLTTTNIKGAGSVSVAIADGVITVSGTDNDTKYTLPNATTSVKGGVIVGDNINVDSGTISVPAATSTTLGVVKQGTNTTISSGAVNVATANGTTLGVVKQGTNTTISNGAVNVANATATVAGVSKLGVIPVAVDGSKTGTAEIWVE